MARSAPLTTWKRLKSSGASCCRTSRRSSAHTPAFIGGLLPTQNISDPQDLISSLAASALLIEPLSAQEQRVLRLLAAGRSNPEIAQELVVSVNTVKTQAQSIYRKLNVKSRVEAGEAARRLKLL